MTADWPGCPAKASVPSPDGKSWVAVYCCLSFQHAGDHHFPETAQRDGEAR